MPSAWAGRAGSVGRSAVRAVLGLVTGARPAWPAFARTGWRSNLLEPSAEATRSSFYGLIPHNDERVVPGGRPPGGRRRTHQPAARGAARRGAGGARTSRHRPRHLNQPRNAGGGIPLAETYPAPRAAANNLTGNYRQHARAASGGGYPGIDSGARRARRRQRRLRGTTPTLGTTPQRAAAPPRLNPPASAVRPPHQPLARPEPRWASRTSAALRRRKLGAEPTSATLARPRRRLAVVRQLAGRAVRHPAANDVAHRQHPDQLAPVDHDQVAEAAPDHRLGRALERPIG
jgi:hypothetical protein